MLSGKGAHGMVERSNYIHIRVTPEEIEQIRARMAEAGIKSLPDTHGNSRVCIGHGSLRSERDPKTFADIRK